MTDDTCSINECGGCRYCRGWCKKHYNRWQRTGDPLALRKRPNGALRADLDRAAAATTDECIILAGYSHRPNVDLNGTRMFASRAVWIIANGDPGTASVLHTCHGGEGGCINVRHLYLGGQARNVRDMDEAGRGRRGHNKILTESQVDEIRRRHVRGVNQFIRSNTGSLAAEYGVSKAAITAVAARRRWKAAVPGGAIQQLTAELGRTEVGEAAPATPTT